MTRENWKKGKEFLAQIERLKTTKAKVESGDIKLSASSTPLDRFVDMMQLQIDIGDAIDAKIAQIRTKFQNL